MLQKILGAITRPPIPMVLGTIVLVLVIWFGGHLLQDGYGGPSTFTIAALCIGVVVAVSGFVVLRALRARRKARAIENEIRNQGRAQAEALPPSGRSEVDELQRRFDEALGSLKSSKLGRGALYALPWHIIIGPPGSGKTTAITESGLNFPFLKGQSQKRGIRGLGGTRNCDWWFTDQSILLDTAGRYTTQAEDRDEWLAFLGMIKRARKMKPINGVVVALAITDILGATDERIEQHATTIRQRIDELVKHLEVVFPVYLLFTKCDLMDGFVECFGAMSKEERAQVWGTTFAHQAPGGPTMDQRFGGEFAMLCRRLDEERLRLLVADRPAAQQKKILSLSLQLRAARRSLTEFVRQLTQANPYSDASELRGVYLTSGTQEGAPIDFVLAKVSQAMGVATQPSLRVGGEATEAKSYFIRDLFTKVLYGDRDLARSSAAVQKRHALVRTGVVWGSAAAALVVAILSLMAWFGTRSALDDFMGKARELPTIEAVRRGDPSVDAQQRLDKLRGSYLALQDAYSATSLLGPSRATVEAAMVAYSTGIRAAFLVPARKHIEAELRAYTADTSVAKDYTKYNQLVLVYRAMDREFVEAASLGEAIERCGLWRWDPAQLGDSRVTSSDSPDARHLDAFLRARAFAKGPWAIGNDKTLLGKAVEKLESGDELQSIVSRLFQENAALRGASESDLSASVIKELERRSGGTTQADSEQSKPLISAVRKRIVIQNMAAIGLGDTSSLPKTIDALADLDREGSSQMTTFAMSLKELREAQAVPRAGIVNKDPVIDAYRAALQNLSTLRELLTELQSSSGTAGYLLPPVLAGNQDWMKKFDIAWTKANVEVERHLKALAQAMVAGGGEEATRVVEPIKSSLEGMFEAVAESLAREARSEAQRYWGSIVSNDLQLAAQRFPFQSTATEDYSAEEFRKLFGKDGLLDKSIATLDTLRKGWRLNNRLAFADRYEAFVARVRQIQAGCFADGAPAAIRFHIADIQASPPVFDAILRIPGAQAAVDVNKNLGSKAAISNPQRLWPIGKIGAALLLDTDIDDGGKMRKLSEPTSGSSDSAWSLLRVLAAGDSEVVGESVKVTWKIPYVRNDRSTDNAKCWFTFSAAGGPLPLLPGFFQLTPPQHIFQADIK